jgi:hypothetical protein
MEEQWMIMAKTLPSIIDCELLKLLW